MSVYYVSESITQPSSPAENGALKMHFLKAIWTNELEQNKKSHKNIHPFWA